MISNNTQSNNSKIEHNFNLAESSNKKDIHNSLNESHSNHQEEEANVFIEILNGLGDHSGFYWGPHKIFELPYIVYDDGIHWYWNKKQMINDGNFTISHHQIVKQNSHEPVTADLSITNLIFFQIVAAILLVFIMGVIGRKYKKNPKKAPKGIQNVFESIYYFIKDEVVAPNIPSKKAVHRLMPYFFGLFLYILTLNLFGLMPGGHTATGSIAVTAALSIIAFIVIQWTAIKESGIGAWFHHLLGGAPWYLALIMVPIEIVGLFVKPFALTIRLFANMTAGHVVLFALLGFIFFFKIWLITPAIVGFSVFIMLLELLVALIQAYIFTMLTAIFVGLAIGEHAHEEHEENNIEHQLS